METDFELIEITELEDMPIVISNDLIKGVAYATKTIIDNISDPALFGTWKYYIDGIYRAEVKRTEKYLDVINDNRDMKFVFFNYVSDSCSKCVQILYSESGYPYFTNKGKKEYSIYDGYETQYFYYLSPDMIFRLTFDAYNRDYTHHLIADDVFDEDIKNNGFVIHKDNKLYKTGKYLGSNKEWEYSYYYSEGYMIDRYNGSDKHVTFPCEIDGNPIMGIASRFGRTTESYKNLESVIIPNGYVVIGAYAFAECKKLKKVTFPNSLKQIHDGAFLKCSRLENVVLPLMVDFFSNDSFDTDCGRFAFFGCNRAEFYINAPKSKFCYEGSMAFPDEDGIHFVDDSGNLDSIIEENKKRVVYNFGYKTPDTHIGETIELIYDKESDNVSAYNESGKYLGALMVSEANTIVEDSLYIKYVDDIYGVITSEKFPYMGSKGFEIEIHKKQ